MIERYANVKIPLNIAFSRSSFDIKNTSIDKTMCKTMFISANYNFSIKRDERGGGVASVTTLYIGKNSTLIIYTHSSFMLHVTEPPSRIQRK